jgi:hypothetical protein
METSTARPGRRTGTDGTRALKFKFKLTHGRCQCSGRCVHTCNFKTKATDHDGPLIASDQAESHCTPIGISGPGANERGIQLRPRHCEQPAHWHFPASPRTRSTEGTEAESGSKRIGNIGSGRHGSGIAHLACGEFHGDLRVCGISFANLWARDKNSVNMARTVRASFLLCHVMVYTIRKAGSADASV